VHPTQIGSKFTLAGLITKNRKMDREGRVDRWRLRRVGARTTVYKFEVQGWGDRGKDLQY